MEEVRLRNAGVGLIKRSLRFRHRRELCARPPLKQFIIVVYCCYYSVLVLVS